MKVEITTRRTKAIRAACVVLAAAGLVGGHGPLLERTRESWKFDTADRVYYIVRKNEKGSRKICKEVLQPVPES